MNISNALNKIRNIAIFGNSHQTRHINDIRKLINYLDESKFSLIFEPNFAGYIAKNNITLPKSSKLSQTLPHGTDIIISIGGDGTFLHAAQWCGKKNIPIIGVNTGHLGFLANCPVNDTESLINELKNGMLRIEQRSLLHLSGIDIPQDFWPFALNEISISKEDTSSMITVSTSIDGDFLADYLGDGLVISTPTGSTAYNLSLGGPILQPTLKCVVLTPVAPHTLTLRPIVISGDSEIKCLTRSRAHRYRISVDGRSFVINCNTQITIRRADFRIATLRRPDDNFAATLRNKLHWGSR